MPLHKHNLIPFSAVTQGWQNLDIFHFSPIFIIWKENHPFKVLSFLRLLANCSGRIPKLWNWNFLPKYSKLAVERESNRGGGRRNMLVAASPLAININRFDFNHINEAGVRNTCTNVRLVKKSNQYNWFWRSHGTKTTDWTNKQDGRLAPAYFSPEYKNFDQQMQTVKNETTVKNLVFEGFLQTSIPPLISIFYAKEVVQFFLPQ